MGDTGAANTVHYTLASCYGSQSLRCDRKYLSIASSNKQYNVLGMLLRVQLGDIYNRTWSFQFAMCTNSQIVIIYTLDDYYHISFGLSGLFHF